MEFIYSIPESNDIDSIVSIATSFNLDVSNLKRNEFIVAKADNIIAGFGRLINHDNFFEIATLGVTETFRNSKLGERIIEELLAQVKDTTVYAVTVIPEYFKKLGFRITLDTPNKLINKNSFCTETHPNETIKTLMYQLPNNSIHPVGKFSFPKNIAIEQREKYIKDIESLPDKLNNIKHKLNGNILRYKYKPNGWNINQILNHLPDSHMNAYIRFKLALTEDIPTPKSFDENQWANLNDVDITSVNISLALIDALHKKWVCLLKSMSDSDFKREFYFPYVKRNVRLDEILALYAWHGENHLGHIKSILERETL